MKVFAKIIQDQNQEFRVNTILQFGTSWEHIGNIVLINPGSSAPIGKPIDDELNELAKFEQDYHKYEWACFSPDSTMRFIEKVFNGSYIGDELQLNGCIQLFNLFNLKNQDLDKALEALSELKINELTFGTSSAKYFRKKPTYFGWGKTIYQRPQLKEIATQILSECDDTLKVQQDINNQRLFYHPMYINRAQNQEHFEHYKNGVLTSFFELLNP